MHILSASKRLTLAISLIGLCVLQIHNAVVFPLKRGLDATAHIEYIHFLQTYHRVPLANEGWELYQPPLYYFLASLSPSLMFARVISGAMWLLCIAITYWFFEKMFHQKMFSLAIATLIAALPIVTYLTPSISNEFFSGMIITITLVFYVKIGRAHV